MTPEAKISNLEKLYTISEFEQMSEFGENYELIDGRILTKTMPGDEHGGIVFNLLSAIILYDPQKKLGRAWTDTTIKIAGDDGNGRSPDMAYISANHILPRSKGSLTVIPDLVVEVWSPSDIDSKSTPESTRKKMQYWPQHGVKITWCVNPATREVEVLYAPTANKLDPVLEMGDKLDGEQVLPGFKLPVAALFADKINSLA
jgi:Uma2 family endonuclease